MLVILLGARAAAAEPAADRDDAKATDATDGEPPADTTPPDSAPAEAPPPDGAAPADDAATTDAAPADAGDTPSTGSAESEPDSTADDAETAPPESAAEKRWRIATDLQLGEVDLADPLGPVEAVLDDLDSRETIEVHGRSRTTDRLRGDTLTAIVAGIDGALLQFMLEHIAEDGYQILLEPVGARAFMMIALRSRPGQARGVLLVGVERLEVEGSTRKGESPDMLRKLLVLPAGGVLPIGITEQLAAVGYRATIQASGPGAITIEIHPGRAIRRVRVRGHLPLSKREIHRVLSQRARPGALAPGKCLPPKEIRDRPDQAVPSDAEYSDPVDRRHSLICEPGDLACDEWERNELARLHRFMFDNGFLKGRVSLAFACGRNGEEVDLHVTLRKGPAYRVGKMVLTGNLSTRDQRWIRRVFRPRMTPILPLPRRVTRKHIEDAKERVAREYAEPRTSPGSAARRELELPYPGVRVDTNFDRIDPSELPPGRRFELDIDVTLGSGIKTRFLGNDHVTDNRLRGQLQLFKRREPANAATAHREAAQLRGYYQSRGFMLAKVQGRFDEFGSAVPALVFDVTEGPRTTVREAELSIQGSLPPVVRDALQRAYRQGKKIDSRGRFTEAQAREDLGLLLANLADRGYLCAQASMRVAFWPEGLETPHEHAVLDPFTELDSQGTPAWLESQLPKEGLERLRNQPRAGVFVRIDVFPGPRVVTSDTEEVRYLEQPIPPTRDTEGALVVEHGAWGALRMLRDGPLRRSGAADPGDVPIHLTLDREIERDVVRRYRASGYPLADIEVRWRYTDNEGQVHRVSQAERLATPEVGLCREQSKQPGAPVDVEVAVYEGRAGRFGTTLLRGNFKTRRQPIMREKTWREGDRYDFREVDKTRRHIEGIGVTEAVQFREQEVGCHLDDEEDQCVVHQVVTITESKDRALDVTGGIGGATLDPFYVFLRPTLPNMLGTGWDLQLDGHYGFGNVLLTLCEGQNCYERSGRASLVRRRIFASPLTFDLTGQVQQRVTPARGQIDSALGQLRLTWPIGEHWRIYGGYLAQVANISKDVVKPILGSGQDCTNIDPTDPSCTPPNRGEAIVPDQTGAVQAGAVWQQVDNPFNPADGIILTLDGLFATPSLGSDWWLRADVGWQHFVPIPGTDDRLNFRYSLRYGHIFTLPGLPGSASSAPEVWRYFGGGTTDLGIRGIEPQTMLVDVERIAGPYGTVRLAPTAQGGHIRALGTVALQFVTVPNFIGGKLAHSLFVDMGVLTQKWSQVQLGRDLRRSFGVNFVKWDIRIVTVSVGYAWLVPDRIWPGGNVGPTDDRDGRFVFDVGATF
ncbi:MAG: BamA/TamA family outer membrane protein [Myxococcota bacterium]